MARGSKFKGIFDATQAVTVEEPIETAREIEAATPAATPAVPDPEPRPGGRAPGKKSDPRYRQVTAYVRKDVYRAVQDALYDDARGVDARRKEFSQLVNELLEQWVEGRTTPGR